jgi:hypothetical protein
MLLRRLFFLLPLLSFLANAQAGFPTGQTGSVAGTVVADATGAPVRGAGVTISLVPPVFAKGVEPKPQEMPPGAWSAGMTTGEDGKFQFANVPGGWSYRVCVQPPYGDGSDLVEFCSNDRRSAGAVAVGVRQNVILPVVRLAKGHRVKVKFNDPDGHLDRNEGKTAGAHLLVGVWRGPDFVAMPLALNDGKVREYELTLPYSTAASLVVQSSFYSVLDDKGKPVDAAKGTRLDLAPLAAGATGPAAVVFQVTGKR